MLAMGAVYQLIAVVTQQSIYSIKLGFIHFGLYSIGVFGLYISLGSFELTGMIIFGSLTVGAVIIFLVNVFLTIQHSRLKNTVISASTSALFYLGLTVISGVLIVLNFQFSILGEFHHVLLIGHLWMGLIGWFLFLIVGYSFKMLPMFYLAHGHKESWQKWILISLHLCIWVGIFGAVIGKGTSILPIGLGLLTMGLVMFIVQIREIQKKRFKKNPGKGIVFFVFLVYFFTLLVGGLFIVSLVNPHFIWQSNLLTLILVFYILGFVSLSILAYLSKIIPFLWWTFRYGKQVGQQETPSLAIMIDETVVHRKLWLLFISLLLFIVGLGTGESFVIAATSILFAFSTVYYLFTIVKAFTY
ncbi:MFS family permease [Evansella vedderi]|uniref:MFS family permease n=1 Tax=Evansella vedderi TaxID=38282 RepID=A0ABT9ZW38_9BACI|nr:hypothetical protein [Evansella vedderi]MDQ0255441.1 MFS family permease [Evansella vedderi]